MMPRKKSRVAIVLLAALATTVAVAKDSSFVQLDLQPDETPLWRTISGGPRWIEWVMPHGATKATLTVDSAFGGQTVYADLTAPSNLVDFAAATASENEDVVTLTLAFDNGDVQTAKIGVLRSVSETAAASADATCSCVAAGTRKWSHVKDRAVLPIPYGTRMLTIRGESVDTGLDGAAGWHGAAFTQADRPAALSLETDDGIYVASLNYYAGGTVLLLR